MSDEIEKDEDKVEEDFDPKKAKGPGILEDDELEPVIAEDVFGEVDVEKLEDEDEEFASYSEDDSEFAF